MQNQMKLCVRCNTEKPVTSFSKNSKKSDGLQTSCKDCNKAHYNANKEHILDRNKQFYEKNPDRKQLIQKTCSEKKRQQSIENGIAIRCKKGEILLTRTCLHCKQTKENNAENFCIQRGVTRNTCRECNKINRQEQIKSKSEADLKKMRMRRAEWQKNALKNPVEAMKVRIRRRYLAVLSQKGFGKTTSTSKIIGISWEKFKEHIENQFTDGMTWENRSEWHIDHIIPLATAVTIEDVIRLNHYTNLRPLWAIENMKKGARLDYIVNA